MHLNSEENLIKSELFISLHFSFFRLSKILKVSHVNENIFNDTMSFEFPKSWNDLIEKFKNKN